MRTSFTLFAILAYAVLSQAQVNLDSALVGHWPLNGEGTDISGNGFHGTLQGPLPAEDLLGDPMGALDFDGVDDHVELPVLWGVAPAAITFSCWFRTADTLPEAKLIYHGDNGEFQLLTIEDTVVAAVHLGNGNWYFCREGFMGASWHFAAGRWSYDDGKLWLYLDGALVDSLNVPLNALLDVGPNYHASLGSYNVSQTYFFNGSLDEVRIYERALTNEELDTLYFEPTVSIADVPFESGSWNLQPNPATSRLFILGVHTGIPYRVLDALGKEVRQGTVTREAIDIADLAPGTYSLLLPGQRESRRFVKE